MVRVLEQNKGQRRLETGEEVDEVIEIQGRAQSCDSALQAVSDLLRQYQVINGHCVHAHSALLNAISIPLASYACDTINKGLFVDHCQGQRHC